MGYQVHIPLLRSQQCQRHSAKLTIARLQSTVSTESFREPGHKPIPSGHILHGRPINRSVPGRPAIPRTSPGTAQPGRSRRRSPDGPSTQVAPKARNTHGSGVGPHGVGPKAEQVPHRSLRESRAARLTRQWSQGPTRLTVTTSATVAHLSGFNPQADHPWKPLHLVGAHPPCSRKGPHLPACGLKRPRRVKREATNSRFCGFSDSVKICGHNPAPRTTRRWSAVRRGSERQKGTAKPQHPGFPCGPPPWY